MASICLSGNATALVDDDVHEVISSFKWRVNHWGYAVRNEPKGVRVLMHRQIMSAPPGSEVDHINGDKLDNRRSNLRFCTSSQNKMNRRIDGKCVKQMASGRWRTYICQNSHQLHLGCFATRKEAVERYNLAATLIFGEFACPTE